MTRLSLYRKYRPQKFKDVVGQQHVTQTLQNAISTDRVPHALLFSGPRGTGKTSTARILAKAINCEAGGIEPDDTCPSCIEIVEGSSLDVMEIDAASHGSVEDARDVRERVAYAPVRGRRKVYIYDECHMLSPAANNALLKVLEEPPEHVVFVFATTEPHKVLQTLLDRCQRYEFRAISSADIAEHLAEVSESEGIAVDEDVLSLIANRAAGSARDALTVLDQLASLGGDKIGPEDVARLLGPVPEEALFELVDLVADRDVGATFLFTDRMVRSGTDLREFMRALIDHLRSLFLIHHASAPQELLDVSDEQLERLRAQANRLDPAEILRVIDLAAATGVELREAAETRLAFEVGLARMARPELHATPASLLSRIERLERLGGIAGSEELPAHEPAPASAPPAVSKPSPAATKPASAKASGGKPKPAPAGARAEPAPSQTDDGAPPMEPGEVDIERIRRAWPVVLEKVKRRKISFQALLIPAVPAAWADGELVLAFGPKNRFHRDNVSEPSQHVHLAEAFFEVFGVRPRIRCVIDEGSEAPRKQPASKQADDAPDEANDLEVGEERGGKDTIELIREALGGAEIVEES